MGSEHIICRKLLEMRLHRCDEDQMHASCIQHKSWIHLSWCKVRVGSLLYKYKKDTQKSRKGLPPPCDPYRCDRNNKGTRNTLASGPQADTSPDTALSIIAGRGGLLLLLQTCSKSSCNYIYSWRFWAATVGSLFSSSSSSVSSGRSSPNASVLETKPIDLRTSTSRLRRSKRLQHVCCDWMFSSRGMPWSDRVCLCLAVEWGEARDERCPALTEGNRALQWCGLKEDGEGRKTCGDPRSLSKVGDTRGRLWHSLLCVLTCKLCALEPEGLQRRPQVEGCITVELVWVAQVSWYITSAPDSICEAVLGGWDPTNMHRKASCIITVICLTPIGLCAKLV